MACHVPVQLLAVVMVQIADPVTQHAPRRGTQLLGVQGTPLPSHRRLWAWHCAWVAITHNPLSGLQQPPRGQGFGVQGVLAVHWPEHCVATVAEQMPSMVQHAPVTLQGVGLHVVLGKYWPGQLVREVYTHPAAAVQQAPSTGQGFGTHGVLAM